MTTTEGKVVYETLPSGQGKPVRQTMFVRQDLVSVVLPRQIRVILKREEEGGFSAYSPDVKGARTQGETEDETLDNMKEAIKLVNEARNDFSPFEMRYEVSDE
jgi:predicted RNase H-like HicB family nuclease